MYMYSRFRKALAFVVYLIFDVMKKDQGSERMIQISKAIQEGAKAFLKREYIYIGGFGNDCSNYSLEVVRNESLVFDS